MSPVVGMILVLAISIVGIAGILYWGLPAIDEMKANVEFRSAQSQFEELDAIVKELVAGTTEKTAKRWQPSLNRGSLGVHNNTESWLFAVDLYNATYNYDFVWANLSDGNDSFAIKANNRTDNAYVKAYVVTGTSTSTALNVTGGTTGSYPMQMVGANLSRWDSGTWQVFRVTQDSQPRNLQGATFRFEIYSNSTLVAQAWYAATGRIDFHLDAGLGSKSVVENNGAVITGTNGGHAIVNSPPIPPPSTTGGVPRLFARMILMGGNASAGGTDTFDLLLSLYATATLASYDCAEADRGDCVESVKYVNFGTYQAPWYSYLQNRNRGYAFDSRAEVLDGQVTTYLEDRRDAMGFTLLESSLKMSGG